MGSDAAARRLAVSVAALVVALAARGASAAPDDPKDAARELGRAGIEALAAKNWERARDLLQRAYALYPAPTLAVREGDALVHLGRLVEASEAFGRAASSPLDPSSPAVFRAAVIEARASLEQLRPRIPRVHVALVGVAPSTPGIDVRIDGVAIPRSLLGGDQPVNPGLHTIEGRMGAQRVVKTVRVAEGNVERVVLDLTTHSADASAAGSTPVVATSSAPPLVSAQPPRAVTPPAPAAPPPHGAELTHVAGWTGVGVGAAGLGVGVVAGLLALSRASRLEDSCPGGRCPPSSAGDLDAFHALRTVSTIGYVAGAVAGAGGVALLIFGPKVRSGDAQSGGASHVVLRLSPGAARVEGAF